MKAHEAIDSIQKIVQDMADNLPIEEYIEFLEEVVDDLNAKLDAAEDDMENEDGE